MAGGKGAAYQRLQPLQGDISNDLLNAENQEFKHREEDRLIEDRTKGEIDAAKKAEEKAVAEKKKDLEGLYVNPSGFKSHDEPLIEILQGENGVFQQYSNLIDELDKNPSDTKLLAKQIMLKKSIENIKGLRDGMMEKYAFALEGIKSKKLSPSLNKAILKNYNSVIKDIQYNYKIKDNGEIVIENKGYDPDGDGIPNELSLNDVWDPEKMKLQEYFDPKEWITSTKDQLGKHDTTTDNGVTSRQLVGFDPTKADSLNEMVTNTFGKDLESMTPQAKSYINDTLNMDYKNVKESDFTKIKESFARQTKNAYDSIDKTKVDGGTALQYKKYNEEKKPSNGISFIETKQYGKGDKAAVNRYAFKSPYTIKGTSKTSRPTTLSEIRYDKENGSVVLIGKEYRGSETVKESDGTAKTGAPVSFQTSAQKSSSPQSTSSKKTSKSTKKDDWESVTITDKAEVTSILSEVMGVNSYDEIVQQLRGTEKEPTEEAKTEDSSKKTIEGF